MCSTAAVSLQIGALPADWTGMIESIIVRESTGFRTYSGWVLNRTEEVVVLAAVSDVAHEPVAIVIPVGLIVTDVAVAA